MKFNFKNPLPADEAALVDKDECVEECYTHLKDASPSLRDAVKLSFLAREYLEFRLGILPLSEVQDSFDEGLETQDPQFHELKETTGNGLIDIVEIAVSKRISPKLN